MSNIRLEQVTSIQEFDRLRERAIIQQLLTIFNKASLELLSYEDVRHKLHIQEVGQRGLQNIPVDKIVGSVGRYRDFTRSFLPRTTSSRQRWARLRTLATGLRGWPPIEVFQVGDVYFVKDGNHRVSVARAMGMKTIEAYVTECRSPVSLAPDVTASDIILLADQAEFLERTGLDRLRPQHGIRFTVAGRYQDLLAHIVAHQYFLEQSKGAPVDWSEAVTSWYDQVYKPAVELMREKRLLRNFPGRTESDLFAWLIRHELELRRVCDGAAVDDATAMDDLANRYSGRPVIAQLKALQRVVRRVLRLERPPCHDQERRP